MLQVTSVAIDAAAYDRMLEPPDKTITSAGKSFRSRNPDADDLSGPSLRAVGEGFLTAVKDSLHFKRVGAGTYFNDVTVTLCCGFRGLAVLRNMCRSDRRKKHFRGRIGRNGHIQYERT